MVFRIFRVCAVFFSIGGVYHAFFMMTIRRYTVIVIYSVARKDYQYTVVSIINVNEDALSVM